MIQGWVVMERFLNSVVVQHPDGSIGLGKNADDLIMERMDAVVCDKWIQDRVHLEKLSPQEAIVTFETVNPQFTARLHVAPYESEKFRTATGEYMLVCYGSCFDCDNITELKKTIDILVFPWFKRTNENVRGYRMALDLYHKTTKFFRSIHTDFDTVYHLVKDYSLHEGESFEEYFLKEDYVGIPWESCFFCTLKAGGESIQVSLESDREYLKLFVHLRHPRLDAVVYTRSGLDIAQLPQNCSLLLHAQAYAASILGDVYWTRKPWKDMWLCVVDVIREDWSKNQSNQNVQNKVLGFMCLEKKNGVRCVEEWRSCIEMGLDQDSYLFAMTTAIDQFGPLLVYEHYS